MFCMIILMDLVWFGHFWIVEGAPIVFQQCFLWNTWGGKNVPGFLLKTDSDNPTANVFEMRTLCTPAGFDCVLVEVFLTMFVFYTVLK